MRTAARPYIEGMIEALRQAGDQPLLRWDGADTAGSESLAAIYRYAEQGKPNRPEIRRLAREG
jgi:hypothetical protein